jgi:hypothetical protein
MGFRNEIIGGAAALIRAAIKSPDYVLGSAGWSINKDGTAEFNNLTVRGTFNGTDYVLNSSGAFFYSPSEGAGNLVASIAPAPGTDSFGNFYRAGFSVQENTFGTTANLFANALQFLNATGTPVQMLLSPSGLFLYSPGGGLGNLIVSLATAAGIDSYGNAYPKGLNVTTGTISGTTFSGTNFIINSAGAFFYSGAPALNNLIASVATASGTDAFGNSYVAGQAEYVQPGDGNTYVLNQGVVPGSAVPGLWTQNLTTPVNVPPFVSGNKVVPSGGGAGSQLHLNSGKAVVGGTQSDIEIRDSTASGVANGFIALTAGKVGLGVGGAMVWDDTTSQLNLPAAGGPFIQGETFHPVSLASGLSGRLAVKLLPWNTVMIVLQNVACSSTATTYNLGSLPSAAYYPANTQHLPVANTGNINARLFIPTSGALQLICAANPTGTTFGLATTYPNN